MFQELLFDKITAQDIQIEVELLAYHRSNHNITLFQNNLEILKNVGIQAILPLMNNFYFMIYLALVCDTDLAKKKNYTASDFLRDPNNLNTIESKNSIKILEKYTLEVLCQEICVFTTHRLAICVKFDKNVKMCILNRNVDNKDNFFN